MLLKLNSFFLWNRRKVTVVVSLLTLYFLFYCFEIMIDEEINVLVLILGMVCLRTLEVHTFDVVVKV